MMNVISDNEFYKLEYDPVKNRIYFRIFGFWRSVDVVPNYLADWNEVLRLTRPHFTVLGDFRKMITHPVPVKEMHRAVAGKLAQSQLAYLAEISPSDKIAVFQVTDVVKESSLGHIKVEDFALGEQILDLLSSGQQFPK